MCVCVCVCVCVCMRICRHMYISTFIQTHMRLQQQYLDYSHAGNNGNVYLRSSRPQVVIYPHSKENELYHLRHRCSCQIKYWAKGARCDRGPTVFLYKVQNQGNPLVVPEVRRVVVCGDGGSERVAKRSAGTQWYFTSRSASRWHKWICFVKSNPTLHLWFLHISVWMFRFNKMWLTQRAGFRRGTGLGLELRAPCTCAVSGRGRSLTDGTGWTATRGRFESLVWGSVWAA